MFISEDTLLDNKKSIAEWSHPWFRWAWRSRRCWAPVHFESWNKLLRVISRTSRMYYVLATTSTWAFQRHWWWKGDFLGQWPPFQLGFFLLGLEETHRLFLRPRQRPSLSRLPKVMGYIQSSREIEIIQPSCLLYSLASVSRLDSTSMSSISWVSSICSINCKVSGPSELLNFRKT